MKSLLLSVCLLCSFSFISMAQTDMTDQIVNPSFEDNVDDFAIGWTYEGGCDSYAWHVINTDGDDTKDGNNICGLWNQTFGDAAITQDITGLENGSYKVTADMMCSANTLSNRLTTQRIFANNSSVLYGSESDYSDETITVLIETLGEVIFFADQPVSTTAENGPFLTCEVTTNVTDGILTLGVKTNGSDSSYPFSFPHLTGGDGWGWFKVDNFTLTYLGATNIKETSLKEDFIVSAKNGFIKVSGTSSYEVFNILGNKVHASRQLDRGIYLVKSGSSVKKVFVE